MKIVGAIFEEMKIFFLCEVLLILRVDRKRKQLAKDICRGTLDIECERNSPVGLGAMSGDGQNIKNHFSSFRDFFREKPIVSCCWASNIL